jgi:two-component system chemotaxis sensor kinase CheA
MPVNDDIRESLELFLAESGDYLELLNSELLKLEKTKNRESEPESINNMFRAAHSIKGMSGMMGYSKINRLTHKMENLMDGIRQGKQKFTDDAVEVLFRCFDLLTALVGAVASGEPDDESVSIENVIKDIECIMESKTPASKKAPQAAPAPPAANNTAASGGGMPQANVTLSISSGIRETLGEFDDLNLFIAEHSSDNVFEISFLIGRDCFQQNTSPQDLLDLLKESGDIVFLAPYLKNLPEISRIDLQNDDIKINLVYQTKESSEEIKKKSGAGSISVRDLRKPLPQAAENKAAAFSTIDRAAYIDVFIQETYDEIEQMNEALLLLEKDPQNSEYISTVLRVMHSVKSSSAALGFNNISALAHVAESLLVIIKNRRSMVDSELISVLLSVADKVKNVLAAAKQNGPEIDFNDEIDRLKGINAAYESAGPDGLTAAAAGETLEASAVHELRLNEYENAVIAEAAEAGKKILRIDVSIESDSPMKAMRYLLVLSNFRENGDVIKVFPETEDEFEKLNAENFVFLFITSETDNSKIIKFGDIDLIREVKAEEYTVNGRSDAKNEKTDSVSASGAPKTKATFEKVPSGALVPADSDGIGSTANQTLRVDLGKLDNLINLIGELVIIKANFLQISNQLNKIFQNKKFIFYMEDIVYNIERKKDELISETADISKSMQTISSAQRHDAEGKREKGRAGIEKRSASPDHSEIINRLLMNNDKNSMFLENSLPTLKLVLNELKSLFRNESYILDFNAASYKLGKIINNLQTGIMDTRMVPVGQLFKRFQRVVRDLAKAQGKRVNLEIRGEETELDKKVIDELGNPLTHIIRNSVDHALETPEERVKAAKSDTGTIILNAYHEGSNICIDVQDDGRGISSDKIMKKAIEKGIITETEAASLSKREIVNLIFMAGFSTAEKVTDISGRGVGMDIVKKAIENLKGSININTEEGAGTLITIRLPLTLAILSALLVKIDDAIFAIPLESVLEITKVPGREVHTVEGELTVTLRNKILSVTQLSEAIGIPQKAKIDQALTIVVICSSNKQIGICVDELVGKEEIVIKSLSEDFKCVEGISGASVLGDGTVSLILDVPAVIKRIIKH